MDHPPDASAVSAPHPEVSRPLEYRRAAGVALVAFLVGLWAWQPVAPGVWHDDGAYLLLAKSLAEGGGLAHAGIEGQPPGAKFPPLYPATLSVAWRVFPGASAEGTAGALLNVVFLALAAGVSWVLLRVHLGVSAGAAAVGLLPWLSPDLWRLAVVSLSEPLFILVMLAALIPVTLALVRDSTRWAFMAGLAIGLLMLTRTVGVALFGGAFLCLLMDRRWRGAGALFAGVLLLQLPWTLWSSSAAADLPGPFRELMGPYGRWLAEQTLTDPFGSLQRAIAAAPDVGRIVLSLYWPGSGGWGVEGSALLWGTGPLVLAATVAGFRSLGTRGRLIGLTVLLYGAILFLWPHVERRLVAPITPLLFLGMAAAWHGVGSGRWAARAARVSRGGLLLWAGGCGIAGLAGLGTDAHLDAYRIRERMLARSVAAVEGSVPADAVVGAPEFWGALHLITGRSVSPSARFLPLSDPPWGTPEQQFELWDSAGIDFVVLEQGGLVHRQAMDALDAACPGSVQLIASWEGGLLVRLAWDEACRASLGLPL